MVNLLDLEGFRFTKNVCWNVEVNEITLTTRHRIMNDSWGLVNRNESIHASRLSECEMQESILISSAIDESVSMCLLRNNCTLLRTSGCGG